ncbi:hypothetical protein ACVW00_002929 [Marmoricola sp. URHA0025 HA25]
MSIEPAVGSPTFFSRESPASAISAATGSTRPNIQRQERYSRIRPDTAGPIAGATDIARVTLPITLPRSLCGTTDMSVVISSGIITAVPDAWTTRATISTQNIDAGASAARSVPEQKTTIERPNACRVVTRCRNQPVTGMTTAIVSRNAVVSHWDARSVTPNSTWSRGSALTMIVSLRITMKVAATSQRSTAMSPVLVLAPAVGAAESCDMRGSFAVRGGRALARPEKRGHQYDEQPRANPTSATSETYGTPPTSSTDFRVR